MEYRLSGWIHYLYFYYKYDIQITCLANYVFGFRLALTSGTYLQLQTGPHHRLQHLYLSGPWLRKVVCHCFNTLCPQTKKCRSTTRHTYEWQVDDSTSSNNRLTTDEDKQQSAFRQACTIALSADIIITLTTTYSCQRQTN